MISRLLFLVYLVVSALHLCFPTVVAAFEQSWTIAGEGGEVGEGEGGKSVSLDREYHSSLAQTRRVSNVRGRASVRRTAEKDEDEETDAARSKKKANNVRQSNTNKSNTGDQPQPKQGAPPTSVRIIAQYKNENGRHAIVDVSKKIYHDFTQHDLVSAEVDAEGLSSLALNKDVLIVERDGKWSEQGQLEHLVAMADLTRTSTSTPTNGEVSNCTNTQGQAVGCQSLIQLKYPHLLVPIWKKHDLKESNLTVDRTLKSNLDDVEQVPYGISLTQADQLVYGPHRASVCVVDTGTLPDHPDFDRSLVSGASRESNAEGTYLPWNVDHRGHGTHIAGIINAKDRNNYGVRGMGHIPTFITRGLDDEGNARESDIVEALEQCEKAGAKVISLSLSGDSMSQAMKNVVDRLYEKNIMIVAAAGNDGQRLELYPASYDKVVSVGAIDESENLWFKSNYGPSIELTAPGHMILSTSLFLKGEYTFAFYSGTSMAAPHVAGAASLLWSHFPDCTTTQIRYALAYTALDKGNPGCDETYGYGIIQVRDAYNFLAEHSCTQKGVNWGQQVGDGRCSIIDTTTPGINIKQEKQSQPQENQNSGFIVISTKKSPGSNQLVGTLQIPGLALNKVNP